MPVFSRVTEGKVGGLEQELALLVARPFHDLCTLLLVECQDQGVPRPLASGRQAEEMCYKTYPVPCLVVWMGLWS